MPFSVSWRVYNRLIYEMEVAWYSVLALRFSTFRQRISSDTNEKLFLVLCVLSGLVASQAADCIYKVKLLTTSSISRFNLSLTFR